MPRALLCSGYAAGRHSSPHGRRIPPRDPCAGLDAVVVHVGVVAQRVEVARVVDQRGAFAVVADELFNLRGEDECGACLNAAERGCAQYAAHAVDEGLTGVDEFPGAGVLKAGVVVGCEVLREGDILSVEHVHEEGGSSRDLCCGAAVCLEGEGDDGRFCGDGGQRGGGEACGFAVFVGGGDDGNAGGLVAEGELELLGGVGDGCLCCNGFGNDRPFLLRLRLRGRPDVYALGDPLLRGDMFQSKANGC